MKYKNINVKILSDSTPVESLDIERIEIVTDLDNPDSVEIYLLDDFGDRIEGGVFAKAGLMKAILDYYNSEY
jgi:hypothetical protein